jgi:hypothetical protein
MQASLRVSACFAMREALLPRLVTMKSACPFVGVVLGVACMTSGGAL